jgi:opacity protein-like surface antigen
MKHYKKFTSVLLFCIFTSPLFAQGPFITFNAGYGVKMASQNLEYFEFYNFTSGNNSSTSEQVNVSLGKGVSLGAAIGVMFNENIGAELGISYLLGGKSKAQDKYIGGTTDYSLSSRMLRVNPSLVLSSNSEKIKPYAKFGVMVGAGSVFYEFIDNDDGDEVRLLMKLNEGIAAGLTSGIGATFNSSENIAFYGELNMVNMSYAPTKGEITEATFNGADRLPQFTTNEKETEFVDSYTSTGGNPPDSQPSQSLKQKLPFGSFGLCFGVRINL